jgi:photosystem II stability/assembly factor-like uncharacterized protein
VSGRTLLVGTKKGLFIGRTEATRHDWRFTGPHCSGTWAFFDVAFDPPTQTIYAGGASNWYGPAVWRSADGGETWDHSSVGLTLGEGQPPVEQVWRVVAAGGVLYAGTDPAGLFRSDDGGRTWRHLSSLRAHPSSATWRPSNGGLPLCAIVVDGADGADGDDGGDPFAGRRLWVALSAGGVYRTDDGGETWARCDAGLHPCVHALVAAGAAGGGGNGDDPVLYRLAHDGVHRSSDGGETWQDATANLPSRFGFALAASRDAGGNVYAVPLEGSDEGRRHVADGRLAVWRTRDGGASWEELRRGLPEERSYASVLRRGLTVAGNEAGTVYGGTATGQLYGSLDGGDTWHTVARALPPIYAVTCAALT